MKRFLAFVPLGLCATLGVLWMMAALIEPKALSLQDQTIFTTVNFLREIPEIRQLAPEQLKTVEPEQNQPEAPQTQALSIPEMNVSAQKFKISLPALKTPQLALNGPLSLRDQAFDNAAPASASFSLNNQKVYSTDLIPLSQVNPNYPSRARRQSIEGWVLVDFVITEEGLVSDLRIIESEPPRVFDRAALKAIARWKFKPQLIAGVAQRRHAEQKLLFNLNNKQGG